MQLDMHYYGTYAMARTAGLNKEASTTIATASQFVDDNAEKESVKFKDGGRLDVEATAHHTVDMKNIDEEDQRQIWVPFHFLPGNEGDSYTERLICSKNSKIVQEMIDFNLSLEDKHYYLELIGITAHVYADTFSHYGFSGISSRRNKIVNNSFKFNDLQPEMKTYITEKAKKFQEKYPKEGGMLDNIKSWLIEGISGALGHGAVFTYPDRPYLSWSFEYEETGLRCDLRINSDTFLEGCEALYNLFRNVAERRNEYGEKKCNDFSSIKDKIKEILQEQATKEGRIEKWQEAAKSGELFATGSEEIPVYNQDRWHKHRDDLKGKEDSKIALNMNVYNFYRAASVHRLHVLRNLLPSHELVVA